MDTELHRVATGTAPVTDVTRIVGGFCAGRGDGLCHLFLPHTTAGLALMEIGTGGEEDLAALLQRLLPRDDRYRHRHGSPGHGADHLVPVLLSPSLVLAVQDGQPLLGTWQSIVLVDLNPDHRERRLRCTWLGPSE